MRINCPVLRISRRCAHAARMSAGTPPLTVFRHPSRHHIESGKGTGSPASAAAPDHGLGTAAGPMPIHAFGLSTRTATETPHLGSRCQRILLEAFIERQSAKAEMPHTERRRLSPPCRPTRPLRAFPAPILVARLAGQYDIARVVCPPGGARLKMIDGGEICVAEG